MCPHVIRPPLCPIKRVPIPLSSVDLQRELVAVQACRKLGAKCFDHKTIRDVANGFLSHHCSIVKLHCKIKLLRCYYNID
jgi:hypothetical protein